MGREMGEGIWDAQGLSVLLPFLLALKTELAAVLQAAKAAVAWA